MKRKLIYIIIITLIISFTAIQIYKYEKIIKPINVMMKEIDYYYDAYKIYDKNNKVSIKEINKKLKYKNIAIKSCKNYDKKKTFNNLTQCIIDANKKNNIIKNTNNAALKYDKYYLKTKKTNKNKASILSDLYTNVYYLSMYYASDFDDFKKYYNNTIKIVNKDFKKLNILYKKGVKK